MAHRKFPVILVEGSKVGRAMRALRGNLESYKKYHGLTPLDTCRSAGMWSIIRVHMYTYIRIVRYTYQLLIQSRHDSTVDALYA